MGRKLESREREKTRANALLEYLYLLTRPHTYSVPCLQCFLCLLCTRSPVSRHLCSHSPVRCQVSYVDAPCVTTSRASHCKIASVAAQSINHSINGCLLLQLQTELPATPRTSPWPRAAASSAIGYWPFRSRVPARPEFARFSLKISDLATSGTWRRLTTVGSHRVAVYYAPLTGEGQPKQQATRVMRTVSYCPILFLFCFYFYSRIQDPGCCNCWVHLEVLSTRTRLMGTRCATLGKCEKLTGLQKQS